MARDCNLFFDSKLDAQDVNPTIKSSLYLNSSNLKKLMTSVIYTKSK